ncbi:MAG: hypothetical protein ACYCS2_02400 [Acidimicrobiales bacterium]
MTRWTIEVDEDVVSRVTEAASQKGVAPESLAGQVLAESFPPRRRLAFIGMGHSGRGDLSERVKELRAELAEEQAARHRQSEEG